MTYGFNVNSETQRLRAENVKLRKENTELRESFNLDKYQKQCEAKAHEIYSALEKDNRKLEITVERQSSKIEKLESAVQELKEKTAVAKDLEKQLKSCQKKIEECEKENASACTMISQLTAEKKALEQELDQANKTIKKLEKQVEALGGEVEKLNAQNNTDYHNSGSPSSKKQNHKPIPNGRTKTGKKPGGQPGHKKQPRTLGTPSGGTCIVVGDDDPLWDDPEFRFESYSIKHVITPVTTLYDQMYFVPKFVNIKTGAHKNAFFPDELKDEINPSPELKAMLLHLTMYDNVGVQKAQDLLKTLTRGELSPSIGFINKLPIEFAIKSEKYRADAFVKLLGVHAMHVDGTVIKVGGRQYNVTICISGAYILYFFRPRKGHAGVKDTPIEHTTAILIHDHDVVYYNYGNGHQECLEHIKRYLIRSVEVEPGLSWNTQMLDFIKKLMADTKAADGERAKEKKESDVEVLESDVPNARFSPMMIQEYKNDFNRILKIAAEEYKETPPKKWFPDGKNLFERLNANQDAILGFLEDDQVDYENNAAERGARVIKRKLATCMEFRGILNVIAYCEALSVIEMLRATDKPLLEAISDVFRQQASASEKLRLEQEHLNALKLIKESDENILEKDLAKKEELEKARTELLSKVEPAKAEYAKIMEAHKAEQEEEITLNEEEKKIKEKSDLLEHRLYLLDNQLHNKNKDVTFDRNHLAYVNSLIESSQKNIASLNKKLEHEKNGGQQKAPKETKLPVVDSKLKEEARKSVDTARQKLEEAKQGLFAAYALQREATSPLAYNETRDPQKAKDAKAAVAEAQKKLEEAKDAYTEARKKLDAIRKQRNDSQKQDGPEKQEAC